MKFPLGGGRVGVIKGDQGLARKCYKDSLKLRRKESARSTNPKDTLEVHLVAVDKREDPVKKGIAPNKEATIART